MASTKDLTGFARPSWTSNDNLWTAHQSMQDWKNYRRFINDICASTSTAERSHPSETRGQMCFIMAVERLLGDMHDVSIISGDSWLLTASRGELKSKFCVIGKKCRLRYYYIAHFYRPRRRAVKHHIRTSPTEETFFGYKHIITAMLRHIHARS